jgi:hypothetical protein
MKSLLAISPISTEEIFALGGQMVGLCTTGDHTAERATGGMGVNSAITNLRAPDDRLLRRWDRSRISHCLRRPLSVSLCV